MRRQKASLIVSVLAVTFLCASFSTATLLLSADAPTRTIGAKIVSASGVVEVKGTGGVTRVLKPGDPVYFDEDISIAGGSSATIALSDKTLREFAGPATLTLRANAGPEGGTLVGNLTAAMGDMLFSGRTRSSDAVMATRGAGQVADAGSAPVLVHPASGENLLEAPRQFRWKGIEGVPLYRVSVYSTSQMMWQGTTSETRASCPPRTCEFLPGGTYYWVVEAVVGNTTLRSRAASFALFAAEETSALSRALGDADVSVSNPTAAAVMKARLCLDAGAYSKALEVLDKAIAASASRSEYMLRAEADEAMGLTEEAISDYKAASALPSSE
jgi:hypothetical protein